MLINTTPDKEKASSILKMVETTLQMIQDIDSEKFTSNVTREYYEVIRELMSIILLLDGYKTQGEGAHKELIEYMSTNYKDMSQQDIIIIDGLRKLRNRIAYDGFFVNADYIKENKDNFLLLIRKMEDIVKKKL